MRAAEFGIAPGVIPGARVKRANPESRRYNLDIPGLRAEWRASRNDELEAPTPRHGGMPKTAC